jgi:cyclophilin family peptidyl-prolyl cis-trans isomerase
VLLAALLFAAPAAAQISPAFAPPPAAAPENVWYLDLSTGGRVAIQLRPDVAPNHVERIRTLTRRGFYDGLMFHRVVEGFMAQGGDPQGTGGGGSDLPNLAAEISDLPHLRGSVAMARAQGDMNSANSQFYIMLGPGLSLDRQYTVFGRVISGMSFVDAIERGAPPGNPTRIVRASIASDNVPPLPADQLRAAGGRVSGAGGGAPPPPAPLTLPPATQPSPRQ